MSTNPSALSAQRANLQLQFPMSLGVYDEYSEAQKVVDYLSDHEFPVENVLIVGTDLKQLERVTGRLTRGRVAASGALSGAWIGAFVAVITSLFGRGEGDGNLLVPGLFTVLVGALFGLVWALIGYAMTGGNRDFMSVQQVIATRYEILVEHKHIQAARDLVTQMDPMAAAQQQVAAAQAQARAQSQAQPQSSPQVQPQSSPQVQPQSSPQVQPQSSPGVQPQSNPGVPAQSQGHVPSHAQEPGAHAQRPAGDGQPPQQGYPGR